ncbi:hypothetical protein LCGC14_0895150 [marine sediment metagenome]|uniref:NERD domain-containing protein n=1 Tax=marine sediment metagenome TaxID=412755 RepID=A0A0F9NY44_9ZZZZ|nr:MAG: hypothetical protein Lokiarch_42990 [Candidatus Lokiarchaeum sp. GC14_75]
MVRIDSSLKQLFTEIYYNIKEIDSKVLEVWLEITNIPFLEEIGESNLENFLEGFQSISLKRGNFQQVYVVIDKITFIVESIQFLDQDIRFLSGILDYSGFERLIKEILSRNNYLSLTNFRFSDGSKLKSNTTQKRFEIDVIGIYLNYILIIDAKQWKRKDSYGSMNKAANLQFSRCIALKENSVAFSNLLLKLIGKISNFKKKIPFLLIPIIVTLEDNSIKINENLIPIVSIYEFNAFLQELPKNLQYFKKIQIKNLL